MMPTASRQTRGQALAELAIFGSILLMVLAATIRFGLQYVHTQEATQKAFRLALDEAHGNRPMGSGTVQTLDDRSIPDPSRPFGLGEHSPFVGQAAVTWTDDVIIFQPTLDRELPVTTLVVNGQPVTLRQAGYLAWVTPKTTSDTRFHRLTHIFCNDDADTDEEYKECEKILRRGNRHVENGYLHLAHGPGPNDNQVIEVVGFTGSGPRNTSIVMDRCAGQFYDPDACKVQCDNLDGVEHKQITWSNPTGVKLLNVQLPLPGYCAGLWDNPTGNRKTRKLNPDRIINSPGLDLRNTRRDVAVSGRVTAVSAQQQHLFLDSTETVGGRLLRYKAPGGGGAERTTSFPLPTDGSGNPVLDNDTTHEATYPEKHVETWTTP